MGNWIESRGNSGRTSLAAADAGFDPYKWLFNPNGQDDTGLWVVMPPVVSPSGYVYALCERSPSESYLIRLDPADGSVLFMSSAIASDVRSQLLSCLPNDNAVFMDLTKMYCYDPTCTQVWATTIGTVGRTQALVLDDGSIALLVRDANSPNHWFLNNYDGAIGGLTVVNTGMAQAGGASDITLANAASSMDDAYNNFVVRITSGTGSGQSNVITAYVGASRVANVSAWGTPPDATSVYVIDSAIDTGITESFSGCLLATDGTYVYAAQGNGTPGRVCKIKISDGTLAWNVTPATRGQYGVVVSGAYVICMLFDVGAFKNKIYCLNIADGSTAWSHLTRSPVNIEFPSMPATDGTYVYMQADESGSFPYTETLEKRDIATGNLVWSLDRDNLGQYATRWATPAIGQNGVVLWAPSEVLSVDGVTGTVLNAIICGDSPQQPQVSENLILVLDRGAWAGGQPFYGRIFAFGSDAGLPCIPLVYFAQTVSDPDGTHLDDTVPANGAAWWEMYTTNEVIQVESNAAQIPAGTISTDATEVYATSCRSDYPGGLQLNTDYDITMGFTIPAGITGQHEIGVIYADGIQNDGSTALGGRILWRSDTETWYLDNGEWLENFVLSDPVTNIDSAAQSLSDGDHTMEVQVRSTGVTLIVDGGTVLVSALSYLPYGLDASLGATNNAGAWWFDEAS